MRRLVFVTVLALMAPVVAWADFLDNAETEAKVTAALKDAGINGVKVEIQQLRGGSRNMMLQGYQVLLEGKTSSNAKPVIKGVVHKVMDPLLKENGLGANALNVSDSAVTYQ